MASLRQTTQTPPKSALRSKSSLHSLHDKDRKREPHRERDPMPAEVAQPPPPSPHQSYFEKYPTRAERIRSKEKLREDSKSDVGEGKNGYGSSVSVPTRRVTRDKDREKEKEKDKSLYAFPSKDDPPPPKPSRRHQSSSSRSDNRNRSKSGPSTPPPHSLPLPPVLPSYRLSSSSSLTQATTSAGALTPPRTPTPSNSSSDDPLVVAHGGSIATMDALVDQMNGEDEEGDYLTSMGGWGNTLAVWKKRGYHPLYHPPLPTPPEGVKLSAKVEKSQTTPKARRPSPNPMKSRTPSASSIATTASTVTVSSPSVRPSRDFSDFSESTSYSSPPPRSSSKDKAPQKVETKIETKVEREVEPTMRNVPSIDDIVRNYVTRGEPAAKKAHSTRPSTAAPSISEIIKAHSPAQVVKPPSIMKKSSETPPRPSMSRPSMNRPHTSPPVKEEDTGRSSIDSVAEEAMRSLDAATTPLPRGLRSAKSFPNRPQTFHSQYSGRSGQTSDYEGATPFNSRSPKSEGYYESSIYSATTTLTVPAYLTSGSNSGKPSANTQAMAQYLRSPRLTRLLTLRRHPHSGLTVSLADVGSSTGHPVIVYLGLGCVRYLIALYDEVAEAHNLRLVCVDRWGLGRTGSVPNEKRGLLEWASVVEEVADMLGLEKFSVVAHSAGAPYALASALRMGDRIHGNVHLLAPWVSMAVDGGYKWLKYVPSGIIKTAQAAEWKVQGWMLGKPPTLTYEAIGYDASTAQPESENTEESDTSMNGGLEVPASNTDAEGRPSLCLSEYDDLADFDGRFASSSTLARTESHMQQGGKSVQRKTSKGILGLFDGRRKDSNASSRTISSPAAPGPPVTKRPNLKGLRSMSSLRPSKERPSTSSRGKSVPLPSLPTHEESFTSGFAIGDGLSVGLGLDEVSEWGANVTASISGSARNGSVSVSRSAPFTPTKEPEPLPGTHRRSLSLTTPSVAGTSKSTKTTTPTNRYNSPVFPSSPNSANSASPSTPSPSPSQKQQGITLASALLRASHAESLKGGTADLLAILERGDSKPWGFSYADVRQPVKVWYGDKDEKINIGSVRWMERVMKDCRVKIIKGQGHSLMTNTAVVVEVLESVAKDWQRSERR